MSDFDRFRPVAVPQPGDTISDHREKILAVRKYHPEFRCYEVEVETDQGHRADTGGRPLLRSVVAASFGDWKVIPRR